MLRKWDNSEASEINKQRFLHAHKILQRQQAINLFKTTLSDWRSRGADWWHETEKIKSNFYSNETQIKECQNYNELTHVDTNELSRLVNSLAANDLSKEKSNIVDCEFKLDLFKNKNNEERKIDFKNNSNIILDRNKVTCDDIKNAIKLIDSYKDDIDEEETSIEFEGDNAWDALNISNIESKIDSHGNSLKLSSDQKKYIEHLEKDLSTGEQVLHLIHGGAGVGKSFLINTIKEVMKSNNKLVAIACPTGSATIMVDGGQTFHKVFYVGDKKCAKEETVANLLRKNNFNDKVSLVVIDEVSMISAEFLVLLDERLRLVYNGDKIFGGIHIVLSGDYLQMPTSFGTALCHALYLTTTSEKAKARSLFSAFKVFHINDQVRAICEKQKRCLEKFRQLPDFCPSGKTWTKNERSKFRVIDDEISESLTRQITLNDIKTDSRWKEAPIVTSNNSDRHILNDIRVDQFAKETN